MAEEEKKPKERKIWFPKLRNTVADLSNRYLGTRFHFIKPKGQPITILPTWDSLQQEISFGEIQKLNVEMIKAERHWDGGTPDSDPTSAAAYRNEVRDLYQKLGIFYDLGALRDELKFTQTGTGERKESVIINVPDIGPRIFEFSVPNEVTINFKHGLGYKVSFIGTENEEYYGNLKESIKKFLAEIKDELLAKTTDEELKRNINNNWEMLDTALPMSVEYLGKYMKTGGFQAESGGDTGFETRHRSILSGLSELGQTIPALEPKVLGRRLEDEWVVYRHTFRVIKPFITLKIKLEPFEIKEAATDEVYELVSGKKKEIEIDFYLDPDEDPYKLKILEISRRLDRIDKEGLKRKIKVYKKYINRYDTEIAQFEELIQRRLDEILAFFTRSIWKESEVAQPIYKKLGIENTKRFLKAFNDSLKKLKNIDAKKLEEEKKKFLDETFKEFTSNEYKNIQDEIIKMLDILSDKIKPIIDALQNERIVNAKRMLDEKIKSVNRLKIALAKPMSDLREWFELTAESDKMQKIINHTEVQAKRRGIDSNFEKLPNEIGWGLDENGWPLEVAQGDYKFKVPQSDGTYREEDILPGTILLDVFNRRAYRRVPWEFTEYCDLLDISAWTYVQFDAYRDDLRDGRYHTNSLSVMEYIMQMREIKLKELEFKPAPLNQPILENGRIRDTEHAKAVMKFNRPGTPSEIDVEIKPSHLNPAFDIRKDSVYRRGPEGWSKKDYHRGRKLYYDLQENTEESPNPTMTTRGAALWILARVIEDTKYWNESIELMEAIGAKTLGFDIGPNIQVYYKDGKPQLKRWGASLTKNPFKPVSPGGPGWTDIT